MVTVAESAAAPAPPEAPEAAHDVAGAARAPLCLRDVEHITAENATRDTLVTLKHGIEWASRERKDLENASVALQREFAKSGPGLAGLLKLEEALMSVNDDIVRHLEGTAASQEKLAGWIAAGIVTPQRAADTVEAFFYRDDLTSGIQKHVEVIMDVLFKMTEAAVAAQTAADEATAAAQAAVDAAAANSIAAAQAATAQRRQSAQAAADGATRDRQSATWWRNVKTVAACAVAGACVGGAAGSVGGVGTAIGCAAVGAAMGALAGWLLCDDLPAPVTPVPVAAVAPAPVDQALVDKVAECEREQSAAVCHRSRVMRAKVSAKDAKARVASLLETGRVLPADCRMALHAVDASAIGAEIVNILRDAAAVLRKLAAEARG